MLTGLSFFHSIPEKYLKAAKLTGVMLRQIFNDYFFLEVNKLAIITFIYLMIKYFNFTNSIYG